MYRRVLLAFFVVLLTLILAIFNTGKAYAYVAGDPLQTGCWNNAYIANSATLQDHYNSSKTVATIYNWYSRSCITNWVEVEYDTSVTTGIRIDIHKIGTDNSEPVGINHQCYPTDCYSTYTGDLSPTWSDMVDGVPKDCINVLMYLVNHHYAQTWDWHQSNDEVCA
ncbi:hypothetical protein [Dictyobacter kobayashii]|uniref:Uncharacterized protein n=1 Tax=Dictyobacter kobayashii TaxID=2014872 RepID=A0A402ASN2_9CHLR|nr:hypothetical protein [Dictyobacter kobayashii]GCE22128.1 hypothetical protein KDK_59280 [Dictyobacter kobayashii]